MNYQQALDFLFSSLPMYQKVGKVAYKKDLTNTVRLCDGLGNPQTRFRSVHIAGTNGKGSSAHMLASVLQEAGYKTGLYTSPHLKSFTERIKVNGKEIGKEAVTDFVNQNKALIEQIEPSFFEMTVAMAFDHFAREGVDIAIIETGLGGRLDSTNVIHPEICLITNIGWDHMNTLGNSLDQIAKEKAGIIKPGVPVVIGKTQPETKPVFESIAAEKGAPVVFADQQLLNTGLYQPDLKGSYQLQNLQGVLVVIDELRKLDWQIPEESVKAGISGVIANTGLKGRWQVLSVNPLTICDTGHNKDGIEVIVNQVKSLSYDQLYLVLGFVNDKQVADLLELFPQNAHFIFCQAKVPRAMALETLKEEAKAFGIEAVYISDVNEALSYAQEKAGANDLIFVGGSTFVVAELEGL